VRDAGSSSYLATLDPVDVFAVLVDAETRRRGSEHIRQLVILGDGAHWIWKLADSRWAAATQIVDLYHAREHLHALAEHVAFIVTDPLSRCDPDLARRSPPLTRRRPRHRQGKPATSDQKPEPIKLMTDRTIPARRSRSPNVTQDSQ
jgi:hypothetical protein